MMNLNNPIKNHYNSGFSLLEVLITLVIMAISLLGLAGLQATSIKNNLSAYHRSQAIIIAYDVIDRMRANKPSIDKYLSSAMTPSTAKSKPACITGGNGCSSAQMAEHDLSEWDDMLKSSLPSGTGKIELNGLMYTITVTWDDRDDTKAGNTSFTVSYQP
jgi:type IV pilus assembly protein PilV